MAGRPRLIPDSYYPEILKRSGERQSSDTIAAWLSTELGKKVDGRTVRLTLSRIREERAPIARAIVEEELRDKVTSDLTAVDDLLKRAAAFEVDAGKLQDLLEQAESIAKADIAETVDPKTGAFLPLDKIPDETRRAISGIEVFEEFEGEGANRVKIGETVKLKFWDKTRGIELAAKIRSGHMAMEAMKMQKALIELRLKLAGAGNGGPGNDQDGVVVLGPEGD